MSEPEFANVTTPREAPYLWATWLTRLLVGEQSCEWATWFRAHHTGFKTVDSGFERAGWMVKHTDLVRTTARELRDEGFEVTVEDQNDWHLTDARYGIKIAAKPDIVAVKGSYGLILDAKTGTRRLSDGAQVLVYLWMARQLPGLKHLRLDGRVVYPEEAVEVNSRQLDEDFGVTLRKLIVRVCHSNPATRVPSFNDCRFCPITRADCADRVEADPAGGDVLVDFGLDD